MKVNPPAPPLIAGLVLILLIVGFLFSRANQSPKAERVSILHADRHFTIDLLSEEAAKPGRMIKAETGGKESATYTCTAADAAVGVIMATDRDDNLGVRVRVGEGTDPRGRRYAMRVTGSGSLFFVSLLRGFDQPPKTVSVPVFIYPVHGLASGDYASRVVEFKSFAPPERILVPPTGRQKVEGEKFARALFVDDEGRLIIKPAEKSLENPVILATSFSPRDKIGSETPISDYGIGSQYDETSDAVKLSLDRVRKYERGFTFTYPNARIEVHNGPGTLVLPVAKTVGVIDRRTLTMYNHVEKPDSQKKGVSGATVVVSFANSLKPLSPKSPPLFDAVSEITLSPTLEELGLHSLDVVFSGMPTKRLIAKGPHRAPVASTIPNLILKVRFEGTTRKKVGPIVLPVKRVPHDSDPIPPPPPTSNKTEPLPPLRDYIPPQGSPE